jgi:hypothetical protein
MAHWHPAQERRGDLTITVAGLRIVQLCVSLTGYVMCVRVRLIVSEVAVRCIRVVCGIVAFRIVATVAGSEAATIVSVTDRLWFGDQS